ncbi:hypothetical protein ACLOJK_012953 [Asimina triloba]
MRNNKITPKPPSIGDDTRDLYFVSKPRQQMEMGNTRNQDEDGITSSEDGINSCLCFYDVLADHFVKMPESGKPIVDLILFEVPLENSEALLRYASALVQGATNVFCVDSLFAMLWQYLIEDVAFVPTRVTKISVQQFPVFPNTFFAGGPSDIFVIELTDQLQKLKVEPVLLHYLSQVKCLQGMELRMTTSTRLKACLYSFTSPGGPMYTTRAVRHAAWDALDFLFPVGQYPRHLISLFFRLLYPCYGLIPSCVSCKHNFLTWAVKALVGVACTKVYATSRCVLANAKLLMMLSAS